MAKAINEIIGSVSGGCVESFVFSKALEVIKSKKVETLEFGVTNTEAWDVGLTCGGKIKPKAVGGCNSCVYSGHAALMLIFLHYICKYYPNWLKLSLIYAILGSLIVIITRSHYTVDVLVSWLAVYSILKVQEEFSR